MRARAAGASLLAAVLSACGGGGPAMPSSAPGGTHTSAHSGPSPTWPALQPPSFAAMGALSDTRVYDVGYSIADFVVERFGAPALPALIAAHGDTAAVLGVPLADFEGEWLAFVRARYAL